MNPLEIALLQVGVVLVSAPLFSGISETVRTALQEKKWVWPWVPYRRSSTWQTTIMLGIGFVLAILLPLAGTGGVSGIDGSTVTVIGLLLTMGFFAYILDAHTSLLSLAGALSLWFLSFSVINGSVNGELLTMTGMSFTSFAAYLPIVAGVCLLLAIRMGYTKEKEAFRDVFSLLFALLGVCIARLVIPGFPEASSEIGAQSVVLLIISMIGSVVAVALIGELLMRLWNKMLPLASPHTLIRWSACLSIVSCVLSVWFLS